MRQETHETADPMRHLVYSSLWRLAIKLQQDRLLREMAPRIFRYAYIDIPAIATVAYVQT
jgi:hypothetical protein